MVVERDLIASVAHYEQDLTSENKPGMEKVLQGNNLLCMVPSVSVKLETRSDSTASQCPLVDLERRVMVRKHTGNNTFQTHVASLNRLNLLCLILLFITVYFLEPVFLSLKRQQRLSHHGKATSFQISLCAAVPAALAGDRRLSLCVFGVRCAIAVSQALPAIKRRCVSYLLYHSRRMLLDTEPQD